MKRLMLWMIALAAWPGGALLAQSIVGTWQGALQVPQAPGGQLRIVIKISTTDADNLKAVLYSIDQGGVGMNATAFTLQGSAVKMSVAGIGGTYEGQLNADATAITGTWTQGPKPLALNLKRATSETAWSIPEPPPPPKKMPEDANPTFEVATIKPSNPDTPGKSFLVRGRQFTTTNTTLSDLITMAYELHPRQVTGGPAWLETEKYDLLAKPDVDGQPSVKQLRSMLQKLLADRFKLAFHRDKKELSVYALTVGKTGPKLNKSDGDPTGLPGLFFQGLGVLAVRNAALLDFTTLMQASVLDRPVVDQTALPGRYDFTLKWTPDETQFGGRGGQVPPPAEGAETPPDLFTAVQQQLGLKLEPTKAPVEVLVIDRVEKPSQN
ncbi:MAG: TIGR03435 family protein [Bryobacteraceae bacterium]|jgi:uncharacterized protein (TIGR03435 family)